ncbi:PepSY domain-containing protein [Shouchella shacheensis]|uniref:PepSY domain-containing protein n=1 Tax=Shouchella shacheensis TaxID=1649580 RepID=UPI0007403880|nr:DUF5590 domain-containing protein [Shouchella shacheensis]
MKKWILLGSGAFLVVVIGLFVYGYQVVREPLAEGYENASAYLQSEHGFAEVETVNFYHGNTGYYVARGMNEDGEALIAWIEQDLFRELPEEEESSEPVVLPASEGLTEEEAWQAAQQEIGASVEFDGLRLGYEDGAPVYELTYMDDSDRKVFYYIDFADGSFVKNYSLRTGP